MTPKQMALSRLARLALNAASVLPAKDHAEVCRTVAFALGDDCPDLSQLAAKTAAQFEEAIETSTDLLARFAN